MKRITITTKMLLLLVIGLFSCTQEEIVTEPKEGGGDSKTEKEVVFRLAAPIVPQTRSIKEEQENTINSIIVLAFKVETDGTERYDYSAIGQKAPGNTEGAETQNFSVTLKVKEYDQRFVVITNAPNEVTQLTGDQLGWAGTQKEVMLANLKVSLTSGDKWNTISSSNYKAFPMWGESSKTKITSSTSSLTDVILLLRMIAKINVQLDEQVGGLTDKFQMKSVRLYNTNTMGHIVPASTSVTEEIKSSKRYLTVTAPTIPTEVAAESERLLGPLEYTDFDDPGKTNIAMLGAIYTFETAAPASSDRDKATCLVVGGLYSADGGTNWDSAESYYRLDFLKEDKVSFLDILRNHQYDVNIVDVKGRGHSSPEEAFSSKSANMEADILDWDNSGINNIDFDGDHTLGIDKDSLYFYSEGRAQQIYVTTDYPTGWTIDESRLPFWITVTPKSGAGGLANKDEITVTTSQLNSPLADREGYFYITAGRLNKRIKVVQTAAPELTIEVTPTSLVFRKSGSNPKSIVVTTYPETTNVYFTDAPGTNPIVWLSGGFPESGYPNINTYTFQPGPNTSNPAITLNSSVVVYVMGTDGTMVSRSVSVVQLATDLLFDVINRSPYPATAGTNTITVSSDTDWRVSGVEDSNSMLSSLNYENIEAGENKDYSFALTQNNTWDERKATLKVSSTDPDFAGKDIEIIQDYVRPDIQLNKKTIAFGTTTSTTSQEIEVTSNAKWMYSIVSGDLANVGTASLAAGYATGSHSYHTYNISKPTFTPKAWAAATGTPAAGSSYSANLQFTTTDHALAPASTDNLTISRAVPPFFKLNTSTTTVSREGATIAVSASTNAAWNATHTATTTAITGGNTSTGNQSPGSWGTKTANIVLPANNTWSTSTAPANREYTVTAKYGESTSAITSTGGSFKVTQPGYYISASSTDLSSLSAYSTTNVTISLTGAYPTMTNQVKALDVTNNKDLVTGTITAGETGARSTTLIVPANATWASRTVRMQYFHPGTGKWTNADTKTASQAGYSIVGLTCAGTAAGGGFNITVTATSYLPALKLQAVSGSILASTAQPTITAGTTNTRTQTLTIGNNPSMTATRNIQVQYSIDNGSTWKNVGSVFVQPAGNKVLKTGRIVAKNEVNEPTWAEMVGISTIYNTTKWPENPATYTPTANTGCAAYTETTGDRGKWRAPTKAEIEEIARWENYQGNTLLTYQCAEDSAANLSWILNRYTYEWSIYGNKYWSNTRCVRTP